MEITDMSCLPLCNGIIIKDNKYEVSAIRQHDNIKIKVKKNNNINTFEKIPIVRGAIKTIKAVNKIVEATKINLNNNADTKEEQYTEKITIWDKLSYLGLAAGVILSAILTGIIPMTIMFFVNTIINNTMISGLMETLLRIMCFFIIILIIQKTQCKTLKNNRLYHGAYHKVKKCYEKKESIDITNANKQSIYSNFCGTVYLYDLVFYSPLVLSIIQTITGNISFFLRFVISLLIGGLIYETSYILNKYFNINDEKFSFIKKRIYNTTSSEPTEQELEVVIKVFKELERINNYEDVKKKED